MRIKEGDEWKEAFTMHIGSFKPTVMFFGMTNSPVTFQAMMNEILRNLINEGKVAAFVDNVLVETEEEHDEIVEEILRRLEENDLYIKPEKCVWKVRKIGFLGVVIGPNGIEMESYCFFFFGPAKMTKKSKSISDQIIRIINTHRLWIYSPHVCRPRTTQLSVSYA